MNTNSLVVINEKLVFGVIVFAWIVYRVVRNFTVGKVNFTREALLNLAFVYGCLVFKVTFFPMAIVLYAFDPYESNLIPFVGTIQMIEHASLFAVVRNVVGNLIMLAPLGVLIPIFFKSLRQVWKMLGIGFLVSLSIEILQLILKVRIFDVDDLIFNTLGVLLGFLIFLLLDRAPLLTRLFEKVSGQTRTGEMKAFGAYSLVALLAFLSIYSYGIAQGTETVTDIVNALPSIHQTALGTPKFGEYMFVLSQSDQGDKSYALYRRVFFNRYTLFEWGDLRLGENIYTVSGLGMGQAMNFFIMARSQEKAAAVTTEGLKFPLAEVGDYHFSYARLPLSQSGYPSSFHFLDPQGKDLALRQEH